jgi:chloride channel protein, CIC family
MSIFDKLTQFHLLPGRIIDKLKVFKQRYIGDHTAMVLASILVGLVSALAAVVLKHFVRIVHLIPDFFLSWSHTTLIYIISPLIGVLLTVLFVKLFLKGRLEKGLSSILFSVARKSGKVEKSKMYSHMVTSGLTIGFGGSAGLEAPIVITGSAIGSNIASFLGFGNKERTLLLACGAASGIAAVFNSPIAGVIFAVEVLLTDVTIPVFIPLLISTATATILSKFLLKGQLFYLVTNDWYYNAIPFYVLLGVLCGLISVYMTRVTLSIEGFFENRKSVILKAIFGGIALGIMIYLFPPLFGEGYHTIETLLKGDTLSLLKNSVFSFIPFSPWTIFIFTCLIVLLKIVATSITLGSGGNGGIFAPSLFTGGLTGFGTAFLVNSLGIAQLHVSNFIAVGMAGIMSGVVHAPLTAIFLIAEITGGYVLFVPLMIVSALSFFISRYFEPYSIYTKKLAQKGEYDTNDKDTAIFKNISLDGIVETEFIALNQNDTFRTLIDAFTRSKRNVFPVVDNDQNFIGIIPLENFKEYMFKAEMYDEIWLKDITSKSEITIDINESMDDAMIKLEISDLWNIPVTNKGKYIGFISRANILSFYRRILKKSSPMF